MLRELRMDGELCLDAELHCLRGYIRICSMGRTGSDRRMISRLRLKDEGNGNPEAPEVELPCGSDHFTFKLHSRVGSVSVNIKGSKILKADPGTRASWDIDGAYKFKITGRRRTLRCLITIQLITVRAETSFSEM